MAFSAVLALVYSDFEQARIVILIVGVIVGILAIMGAGTWIGMTFVREGAKLGLDATDANDRRDVEKIRALGRAMNTQNVGLQKRQEVLERQVAELSQGDQPSSVFVGVAGAEDWYPSPVGFSGGRVEEGTSEIVLDRYVDGEIEHGTEFQDS